MSLLKQIMFVNSHVWSALLFCISSGNFWSPVNCLWKPGVDRNWKVRKSPLLSLSLPQSCSLLLRADLRLLRLLSLTTPGLPASGLCVWGIACPMWGLRRISRETCLGGPTGLLFPEETLFFGLEVQSLDLAAVDVFFHPAVLLGCHSDLLSGRESQLPLPRPGAVLCSPGRRVALA